MKMKINVLYLKNLKHKRKIERIHHWKLENRWNINEFYENLQTKLKDIQKTKLKRLRI